MTGHCLYYHPIQLFRWVCQMTREEFAEFLREFTLSAESGDGARFARHFTEDAVYHDYIYGAHRGRTDIAHMLQDLFHRDATDYR
jgi:hypothetical protein